MYVMYMGGHFVCMHVCTPKEGIRFYYRAVRWALGIECRSSARAVEGLSLLLCFNFTTFIVCALMCCLHVCLCDDVRSPGTVSCQVGDRN